MVIFMPYYRSRIRYFHSQSQTNSNEQTNPTIQFNICQIVSNILCRLAFSLFLFIMALFLLKVSIENTTNQNEGSPIIATILLTIAIVSFIRTYQKLKQYYVIMDTRRRLIQRLREQQQQAYDLTIALNENNNNNATSGIAQSDLPSYKELFPSQLNLTHSNSEPLPSYDEYLQTLVNPSSSTDSPSRCLWITDRMQRPICIRGTVTYV